MTLKKATLAIMMVTVAAACARNRDPADGVPGIPAAKHAAPSPSASPDQAAEPADSSGVSDMAIEATMKQKYDSVVFTCTVNASESSADTANAATDSKSVSVDLLQHFADKSKPLTISLPLKTGKFTAEVNIAKVSLYTGSATVATDAGTGHYQLKNSVEVDASGWVQADPIAGAWPGQGGKTPVKREELNNRPFTETVDETLQGDSEITFEQDSTHYKGSMNLHCLLDTKLKPAYAGDFVKTK